MTLQASLIKSAPWTGDAPSLASRLRSAAAAVIARARRQDDIRLWMLNGRLLRDCGFTEIDGEVARLRDANSIALGHFGFASLLLQNRRAASAQE